MLMTFESSVSKMEAAPESMVVVSIESCDTYHNSRGNFQFIVPLGSEVIKDLCIGQKLRIVLNTETEQK